MKAFEFKPKLYTALKNYSKELFMADLMAGIIVGIVALPLAIAFGIASGVSPEKGIITAIIAGFIISLLGGSKVQIGGPTGNLGGKDRDCNAACETYNNGIGDKLNDCSQLEHS